MLKLGLWYFTALPVRHTQSLQCKLKLQCEQYQVCQQ